MDSDEEKRAGGADCGGFGGVERGGGGDSEGEDEGVEDGGGGESDGVGGSGWVED